MAGFAEQGRHLEYMLGKAGPAGTNGSFRNTAPIIEADRWRQ